MLISLSDDGHSRPALDKTRLDQASSDLHLINDLGHIPGGRGVAG